MVLDGKKKVMSVAKKTFLSSTFWSEKIGFVAALATLRKMKKIKSYNKLISKSLKIKKGLEFLAKKNNISITFTGLEALINFEIKGLKNEKLNKIILSKMLDRGFLAGNKIYVSVSHTDKLINQYLKNMNNVFKKIKKIL
jgi:glutamate-1-semialdehyde aminotransferase